MVELSDKVVIELCVTAPMTVLRANGAIVLTAALFN